MSKQGTLVVSLDFELIWGIHDVFPIDSYKTHLLGAHQATREMLQLFHAYDIHATWAIVGLLYCRSQQEMQQIMPEEQPTYSNQALSAYRFLEQQKGKKGQEKLYAAPDIIAAIAATPNQEIATHTFSHYYTLEHGQTVHQFAADLEAALQLADRHQHRITSIVFPRNQIHDDYVRLCSTYGITAYRGNEKGFVYQMEDSEGRRWLKRGLRFLDRYLQVFGHQTYELPEKKDDMPMDIRSSRFLTPYTPKLRGLESIRLRRIQQAMTYAAKHGEIFHLWWHPHNFGKYIAENIRFLSKILQHYKYLQETYGFTSQNMQQLVTADAILEKGVPFRQDWRHTSG